MIEKIKDVNLAMWLKLIVPIISRFLPGWVGAVLLVVIEIINGLPKEERPQAKAEVNEAAREFILTGDSDKLAGVAKKYHRRYCEGPDCELTPV